MLKKLLFFSLMLIFVASCSVFAQGVVYEQTFDDPEFDPWALSGGGLKEDYVDGKYEIENNPGRSRQFTAVVNLDSYGDTLKYTDAISVDFTFDGTDSGTIPYRYLSFFVYVTNESDAYILGYMPDIISENGVDTYTYNLANPYAFRDLALGDGYTDISFFNIGVADLEFTNLAQFGFMKHDIEIFFDSSYMLPRETITFDNFEIQNTIPEPATFAYGFMGLASIVGLKRRFKK